MLKINLTWYDSYTILSPLRHQSPSIPLFPSLKCVSLPFPLGSLPWLGFIHGRLVTEAGTTGIFFMKMPQSLHPLGALPGAVFHNQVNHKQPLRSLPSPTSTSHPTHTPGRRECGGLFCVQRQSLRTWWQQRGGKQWRRKRRCPHLTWQSRCSMRQHIHSLYVLF